MEDFKFREYEAGPRRDVAREFSELIADLGWLMRGEKYDKFLADLKVARDSALDVAADMLRHEK